MLIQISHDSTRAQVYGARGTNSRLVENRKYVEKDLLSDKINLLRLWRDISGSTML